MVHHPGYRERSKRRLSRCSSWYRVRAKIEVIVVHYKNVGLVHNASMPNA